MDKYRPCPSIIAMFTSDSQHPPRSRHAVYLGVECNLSLSVEGLQALIQLNLNTVCVVNN